MCWKYLPGGLGGGERPHGSSFAEGADWLRDRQQRPYYSHNLTVIVSIYMTAGPFT
jgi:hypothetical protein